MSSSNKKNHPHTSAVYLYGIVREYESILPALKKIARDNTLDTASPKRQAATAALMGHECGFRVGNTESAREKKHYGTTTMLGKHVLQDKIAFVGKSCVYNSCKLTKLSRSLLGNIMDIKKGKNKQLLPKATPKNINQLLDKCRTVKKKPFTSQDIRRIRANRTLVRHLPNKPATEESLRKKEVSASIEKAACSIQNKPATCRKS